MKRNFHTATNIQQPKRQSLVCQPEKRFSASPNVSAKHLNQQPSVTFEPAKEPRYATDDGQLQQRVLQLEAMYEGQIATLSLSLQEKNKYNGELSQRVRELEAEILHLQKKVVEVMRDRSVCDSVEKAELQKENMLLKDFIEKHIKDRLSRKNKLRESRSPYGRKDGCWVNQQTTAENFYCQ